MFEVRYAIDHAAVIVDQLKAKIGGMLKGGRYVYNTPLLAGDIQASQINESVSCMVSAFTSKNRFRVRRTGTRSENLVILDFHVSEKVTLELAKDKRLKNLIFGSYFASSNIESFADFCNDDINKQIAFVMDRNWVLDSFARRPFVTRFLEENENFFIYNELELLLANEINDLHQYALNTDPEELDHLYISGQTLKILSMFFASFGEETNQPAYSANKRDILELLACKEYIHANFLSKMDVKMLADRTSMSESKFRKKFKSTFQKSPYEYLVELRMWHAKSLLAKGEQISQVAYEVGYTSLSYFTKNFKKTFGLNPGEYQKSVLAKN